MTFLRSVDPTILLIVSHAIAVATGMTICCGLRFRAARHADQRWQAEMQRIDDVRLLSVREAMFTADVSDISVVATVQLETAEMIRVANAAWARREIAA